MIGGVTAYLVLDKKHKLDTLDDFWNKVSYKHTSVVYEWS